MGTTSIVITNIIKNPTRQLSDKYINVTVESSRLMITLPGLALYVAKLALAQSMGYSYYPNLRKSIKSNEIS
jgi:hypothetical protein